MKHLQFPSVCFFISFILFIFGSLFLLPSLTYADPDLLDSWEGAETGEQFGIATAIGGDFNNDGWADLALGSSTSDIGGENSGKVSIFLGRSTPLDTPDLVVYGAPGSFFGAAISWVGDIDQDGFDDLLVGAFRDDENGTSAGKAYLFLGNDPIDGSPDLVIPGPSAGAYFGRAVSGAGDMNEDGFDDFIVGAPRTTFGSVYLYFGSSTPDGDVDLLLQGPEDGSRFGTSISGLGDIDGISGDDIIVGAPRVSTYHTWQGASYLYIGGIGLDDQPDWEVLGDGGGDNFGISVAFAGDINGDGAGDILVGAPYYNQGSILDVGIAYLFYGGDVLDNIADFTIEGQAEGDNLGRSVAGCGDVTGSGFDHFIAGAPGEDGGGVDTGMVVISIGGNPPVQQDLIYLTGEADGDQFGYSVAGKSDYNGLSFSGDSHPDFLVGAWSHDPGGKGYVYGIEGSSGIGDDYNPADAWNLTRVKVYPNPSNAFTFDLKKSLSKSGMQPELGPEPAPGPVTIRITDIRGARIRVLPINSQNASRSLGYWDGQTDTGRAAAPGIYFYKLESARGSLAAGRLMLIR